ncbi:IS21 family transposase, partial [Aliarcobacter butzleri]
PSMKQVHLAGEKLFVDYSGATIPIVNQRTGEITKAQIFVAVLGASGYTFVHATYSQKQRDFILSHTLAYDFFGGVPLIVVPDNLKSAVIKHSKKDGIVINESYSALARHYNMAVAPARPYKPKDKSKAEQGVQGIQRWILAVLRHQTFFSVDELNDAISLLLDKYN